MLPVKREPCLPIQIERMPIAIEQLPAVLQVEAPAIVSHILANFGETTTYFEVQLLVGNLIENSVRIQLVGNWLIVKGAIQPIEPIEQEKEKIYWHVCEIVAGNFEKRFFLPQEIDEQKVVAYYKAGILSILLLKKNNKQITDTVVQYL
ncbi:MAG: Hsp20/alpha crystallin family protein [Microscillaceae bacterium]|nr:Hsp20/alpha crystallin family protein [Microscillaceae bacterium]MDW8459895.1 Hsp20/alpha crystallin family protein [Cytophagales bacterium]